MQKIIIDKVFFLLLQTVVTFISQKDTIIFFESCVYLGVSCVCVAKHKPIFEQEMREGHNDTDVEQTCQKDPRGRHTVTAAASTDHYFRTCCLYVRPSPLFKISQSKSKQISSRNIVITSGGTEGLAEWITDETNMSNNLLYC